MLTVCCMPCHFHIIYMNLNFKTKIAFNYLSWSLVNDYDFCYEPLYGKGVKFDKIYKRRFENELLLVL